MVKVTKDVSKKNRADLLQATGQAIRGQGLAVASVGAIAAQVGLTHGAVYRQFPSKDALAAAAVTADFDKVVEVLERITAQGGSVMDYARIYLDPDHRDHFVWGCPVSPLAAEIGRSSPIVQTAFFEGLQRNIDALSALSGIADAEQARAFAISVLASLSGALAMARATRVCAPDTSHEIMQAALRALATDPRLPQQRAMR